MAEDLARMGRQLTSIGRIEKCRGCSCYVETLREYQELLRRKGLSGETPTAREAEDMLREHPQEHGCLGCDPCYPAILSNRMFEGISPSEDRGRELTVLESRSSDHTLVELPAWPPVPGEYEVGNMRAPVAISTLASPELVSVLVQGLGLRHIALVGKTETENLGVEKVVGNVVSNPSIRTLILCGKDAQGHQPGATLLALARNGVDGGMGVVGSPGRRPLLRNVTREQVGRFREQVDVVDLVGQTDVGAIGQRVEAEAAKARTPLTAWSGAALVPVEEVDAAPPWVPDPAGYFVVLLDRPTVRVILERYAYDGHLLAALRGSSAKSLYEGAIARGWMTRLDHAAYLGRELARAEQALQDGTPYVQDGA